MPHGHCMRPLHAATVSAIRRSAHPKLATTLATTHHTQGAILTMILTKLS